MVTIPIGSVSIRCWQVNGVNAVSVTQNGKELTMVTVADQEFEAWQLMAQVVEINKGKRL